MPHNRPEREAQIRDQYHFVVFGGEYSLAHAALAAIDAVIDGGNLTYDFLKDELTRFGIELAISMASAKPPVLPTEPLYVGKMIFENWEEPLPGLKIALPNKFVPYVAARKKGMDINLIQLANLGNSPYKNSFLDIDGDTGSLMLNANGQASGCAWLMVRHGGHKVKLQNLGNSPYKGYFLDINGGNGALMLNPSGDATGCRWRLSELGGDVVKLQNLGTSSYNDWFLDIDGGNGHLMLNQNGTAGGCSWRLTYLPQQ